jgi:hypothetical protein
VGFAHHDDFIIKYPLICHENLIVVALKAQFYVWGCFYMFNNLIFSLTTKKLTACYRLCNPSYFCTKRILLDLHWMLLLPLMIAILERTMSEACLNLAGLFEGVS